MSVISASSRRSAVPAGRAGGSPRPAPAGVRAAFAWTGLGLAVAAAAAVLLPAGPLAACLALLAFMSFGPGCAVLCHMRFGSGAAAWAMALVLSLSVWGLTASAMVWAHWWRPRLMLAALCLLAIGSAGARLVPARLRGGHAARRAGGRRERHGRRVPRGPVTEPSAAVTGDPSATVPARRAVPARAASAGAWAALVRIAVPAVLPVAAGCWVVAVLRSRVAGVGDYGLLSVMRPGFFVAIALCVLGFLTECARARQRGWLLVGYLALMILILHATVPLRSPEPEYAWTYKHIGVIELFRTTGGVTDPGDLYQAWPSLFAVVAQLVTLSGASTLRVAAWAPVFFDAAGCLPLYAAVRSLTGDRRLPYLTVFVFTCVNWVAQDYLSPQAFAYVLCLGAVLIMLRWLRCGPAHPLAGRRAVRWPWGRWLPVVTDVPYASRQARRRAVAALCVVDVAVVLAHQLSPYLLVCGVAALVLLGLVRPWYVAPVLLGIALLYLLPNYHAVQRYGVFGGLDVLGTVLHSTQGVSPAAAVPAAGRTFSVQAVQLLSLAVWGLAALAVATSRNRWGSVAAPAALAFAPFGVLFAQGYGGEAIYRVFLFSAPWSVYLAVTLVLRLRRLPRVVAVLSAGVVLTAATLAGLQGAHGQLAFDRFSPAEVGTMRYVFTHVPPGSTVLSAAPNVPARFTANYGDFNGGADPESLTDAIAGLNATVTPRDLADIDEYCSSLPGPVYVVFTDSMISYAHYFGYLPDGTLQRLRAALAAQPGWSVFYRDGDAVVYQFPGAQG